MNETKFRVWEIDKKQMHEADDICVMFCSGELRKYRIFDGSDTMNFIGNDKHFEVMQYTGLDDKNGKEIYEGDIVRYINCNQAQKETRIIKWSVKQNHVGFNLGVRSKETKHDKVNLEIMGNIYQTPELIK